MPQFSGLVNVSVALVTWCLARLTCAGKVRGMTDSSPLPDSTPIPQVRRRRLFGIRLHYWLLWLASVISVVIWIFLFDGSLRIAVNAFKDGLICGITETVVKHEGVSKASAQDRAVCDITNGLEKFEGISADNLWDRLGNARGPLMVMAFAAICFLSYVGWLLFMATINREKEVLLRLGIDEDAAYDHRVFSPWQSCAVTIPSTPVEAMKRAIDSLAEYGAVIAQQSKADGDVDGLIKAVTSHSWRGLGKGISISVSSAHPCNVVIRVVPRTYLLFLLILPRFFTDYGRSWELLHALKSSIAGESLPTPFSIDETAITERVEVINMPPAILLAGAWQRLIFNSVVLIPVILLAPGLLLARTKNEFFGVVAAGVGVEMLVYFKFRQLVKSKRRSESQETWEFVLNCAYINLLILVWMFLPAGGWNAPSNIAALVTSAVITFLAYSRLQDKRRGREQRAVIEAGREKAELEHQLAEAKLVALSAQIEPHFLFNTLASIQYLIRNDSGKASEMTSDLIRYLRLALPRMKQATARLADELELVRAYLGIMQIRMGSRLQFAIDSPNDLGDVQVPTMTLITLVENAIKHGLEQKADGGMINLMAREGIHGSGTLRLTVADTGGGFSTAVTGTGIGLANIRERLDNLYRGNAKLELEANQPTGVKAILILPMERT
jgi:two-component sensor histidine kinase